MNTFKPDAQEFRNQLKVLQGQTGWAKFLFHFTTLENTVEILRMGELLSRSEVQITGNFDDSASPDIIDQTDEKWKDHVRFYFRPCTPTLYNIEGFRPKTRQRLNAHCPVPIYLLFDIEKIICQKNARFSSGSLARQGTQVFSTADEFKVMPFEYIYHDLPLKDDEKDKIINHRHAEVIVPKRLGLQSLEYILCRSQAEKETLRHYLPSQILQQWHTKIITYTKKRAFFKRWSYLERVTLTDSKILFYFHLPVDKEDQGPFQAKLEIRENWTNKTYLWENDIFNTQEEIIEFDLSNLQEPRDYDIRFTLDHHLAYAGRYQQDNLPY